MQRKVIQQGPATLSVSLPALWVKKFNVKRGDSLFLEEKGNNIEISRGKISDEKKKITINTDDSYDCSVLARMINAAYVSGYNEIEIIVHKQIFDYRSTTLYFHSDRYKGKGSKVNVMTFITDITQFFIGFEIVSQSKDKITLKELASTSTEELSTISNRIYLIAKEIGNTMVEGLENLDINSYEACNNYEHNINKFFRYYRRIINKTGLSNMTKGISMYEITAHIEEICDTYKDIIRNVLDKELTKNIKINKEFTTLAKKVVGSVNKFIEILSSNDSERMIAFYKENSSLIWTLEENIAKKQHPLLIELKQILFHLKEAIQNSFSIDL